MPEIRDILDAVVNAARSAEAARIDAGTCQTRLDFEAARKAESALYDALEVAERQLTDIAALKPRS